MRESPGTEARGIRQDTCSLWSLSATIVVMLLPRFTLRSTLIGVTGCGLFCLILVRAAAGDLWAIAASFAAASLIGIVFVHGCFYVVIAALARVLGSHTLPARTRQGGVQASPDKHYLPSSVSQAP